VCVVRNRCVVRPRESIAGVCTATPTNARGNYHDFRARCGRTRISDDIRTTLNLSKEIQAAVIADIDAESPAEKAGLREGDVIQEVNKQPVRSAKDLLAISKKLGPNEKILIRVYSQGRSGYVALDGG